MRVPVRPAVLALVGALMLTCALVGVGTALADGDTDPPEPFRTTALEDFDTTELVVQRQDFCDEVDPRQLEAALGGESATETSWGNGDRIELPSGGRDVVHEYGCEYVSADGTKARAWVFAPPIDVWHARKLVKQSWRPSGCAKADDPEFGDPSVRVDCLARDAMSTSYQGLFGDAWLTCELSSTDTSADPNELVDRAGRWCVGAVTAASG